MRLIPADKLDHDDDREHCHYNTKIDALWVVENSVLGRTFIEKQTLRRAYHVCNA